MLKKDIFWSFLMLMGIAGGLWGEVFNDDFNASHDYVSQGVAGTNWTELHCSPVIREDLMNVPLQAGLFQVTFSGNHGYVAFDDFSVVSTPPSLKVESFSIIDSEGIKMIRIEPGTFVMGSPESEPGRHPDEIPHQVAITKAFYMAKTEITQQQYIPVMIPNYDPLFISAAGWEHSLPEVHCGGPFFTYSKYYGKRENCPMEGVTWFRAVEFCQKLTEKERRAGRLPEGYVYRLPTEAEWEYACRAGTAAPFNAKGIQGQLFGEDRKGRPIPVKENGHPNTWGLYDMHGNVYEWCLDDYAPYERDDQIDPVGVAPGARKVARGGAYLSGCRIDNVKEPHEDPAARVRFLRSAARNKFLPDVPLGIIGFRIVLAPKINYTRLGQ